jgi:signal transduction histidine kinase
MSTEKSRTMGAFAVRLALPWAAAFMVGYIVLSSIIKRWGSIPGGIFALALLGAVAWAITAAISHHRRVRLIAGEVNDTTLALRHRREIELPMDSGEAFDLIEATVRELPRLEGVDSERGSLQVRARVRRPPGGMEGFWGTGSENSLDTVTAIVTPGDLTSRVTLLCEPQAGAWVDWFLVDNGANLENMAAVTRVLTRRLAERMRQQQVRAKQEAVEKELAVAKLGLLQAQVEPHFLYNTLASAQYLARTDPPRAEHMLGHLIEYLRRSLPRTEDAASTLGEELERAQAYLEILRIRMGERLQMHVEVPEELKAVPMPAMMLQTLVENAIKHGLEPVPGGGSIWIIARARDGQVSVTVADDGRGLGGESSGTGIGLKNVRERLRLAYGDAASLAVTSNFPKGVAATLTLPLAAKEEAHHA